MVKRPQISLTQGTSYAHTTVPKVHKLASLPVSFSYTSLCIYQLLCSLKRQSPQKGSLPQRQSPLKAIALKGNLLQKAIANQPKPILSGNKQYHYMKTLLLLCLFLSAFHCQICSGASFFNGQRCAPCLANCQCSQQDTCTSCLSGYTYDALFQNCLQCPTAIDSINIGCSECCYQVQGPAFVCSSCPAGTYTFLQGGQCIKVAGCTSLSTEGVCSSCALGYYLNQGACSLCDASCASCYDSSLCLSCNPGYYNATNGNYALCQACSAGCTTCSSSSNCSACSVGYRQNGAACAACSANCNSCNASSCTACNSMSVLISSSCYLCNDTAKQGSTGCLSCTPSATRILCNSCASGYYLDPSSSACYACNSKFTNSLICTYDAPLQCANDAAALLSSRFYLVGNQCLANSNNCKDMLDSSGKCSSCYFTAATGYFSLSSGVCTLCSVAGCSTYSSACQCLSCQSGYQFINNQCIACQSLHCSVCQASVTACQQCAPAYGRLSSACQLCQPSNCYNCDGDNTVCATCNVGYYLSGGNCYRCQTNCLTCVSNTQCTTCTAGTYLQSNGRCKTLPANCISIDTTSLGSAVGSCMRCAYGYILLQGNCYPCGVSLFNMGLCNSYHCPDYYANLTFETHTCVLLLANLLILLLLS